MNRGDSVFLADQPSFERWADGIDVAVPLRSEGRTSEHVERRLIVHWLLANSQAGQIDWPLTVEWSERPDFRLRACQQVVGLEVTEAVPENWARVMHQMELARESVPVLLPRMRVGDPLLPREEIAAIARGERPGEPWAGDASEREWADAIRHVTKAKDESVRKSGYGVVDDLWLLIYTNLPVPSVKVDAAAENVGRWFDQEHADLAVSRIYIQTERECVKIGRRQVEVLPIP